MSHHPHITPAELEIMKALWKRGPSTVRQVLEGLPEDMHLLVAGDGDMLETWTEHARAKGLAERVQGAVGGVGPSPGQAGDHCPGQIRLPRDEPVEPARGQVQHNAVFDRRAGGGIGHAVEQRQFF